ncbi:hypothetical protein [Arundinibacter roseus]|uniref:Uncharacterized protein n=1 Tax=Arundinibacter roseus TaxID=2070510 RepID=A0A4R4K5U9_9BACT|nr:hypothetical protein [Arundinibacter roseus]TDB61871.1 hypothetical protein EZE20_19210 [Arundinibacter roseus]
MPLYLRILSLLISSLFLTCTAPPQATQLSEKKAVEVLLRIRDIAGQTQEDIATILGHQQWLDPEKAEQSACPTCQKYTYQDGFVDIVYSNDAADRITISPPAGYKGTDVPALLGLPEMSPDSLGNGILLWTKYPGILNIQAAVRPDEALISITVRVLTPY